MLNQKVENFAFCLLGEERRPLSCSERRDSPFYFYLTVVPLLHDVAFRFGGCYIRCENQRELPDTGVPSAQETDPKLVCNLP